MGIGKRTEADTLLRAHNPKVAGSNPAPATSQGPSKEGPWCLATAPGTSAPRFCNRIPAYSPARPMAAQGLPEPGAVDRAEALSAGGLKDDRVELVGA